MSLNVDTDEVQNHVRAFTLLASGFKKQVSAFVSNAYPSKASEENLLILGRDRNQPRVEGENLATYRDRVVNAFENNIGSGNAADIIRIMISLGYLENTPDSFIQGNNAGGEGSFNVIIQGISGSLHNAVSDHDDTILHNSTGPNKIGIELVQALAITQDQEDDIRNELRPIIRASSEIIQILKILP